MSWSVCACSSAKIGAVCSGVQCSRMRCITLQPYGWVDKLYTWPANDEITNWNKTQLNKCCVLRYTFASKINKKLSKQFMFYFDWEYMFPLLCLTIILNVKYNFIQFVAYVHILFANKFKIILFCRCVSLLICAIYSKYISKSSTNLQSIRIDALDTLLYDVISILIFYTL